MNLAQLRERLAAINAQLEGFDLENLSDSDIQSVEALNVEFEQITAKISTLEKVEAMKTKASASTRQTAPVQAAVEVGQDRRTLDPKGGFQSAGEFFRAVAKAGNGSVDKRLTVQAGMKEAVGEDGGFMVPADFRTEIQKKVQGDESLLPLTQQFLTSSNNLTLPTDEVAPWDASAGIQAYWEGEAGEFTASKLKFGSSTWRLHKLTALVRATDELLDDAPALQSYINNKAPEAMLHKVNSAVIGGSGVGQPHGFLNSAFKFKVLKESGQTADTVNFANVNKMLGRIIPNSFAKSVWIVHPQLLEQIRAMKFDLTSATPIPVYMPPSGVSGAPYGTLYGRPIMPMMGGVKAVGDEGDISLVDLKYYYTALKTSGINSAISTHVYFNTQETAFRFSFRMAGHCPYKAPITTENGAFSMSGFVTLEDR